jgi:hypothetical protein
MKRKKEEKKRHKNRRPLFLVLFVVGGLIATQLVWNNIASPAIRYPNACGESSLYYHAVATKYLNLTSGLIVQVYDTASGFENRYNYWYNEGLVACPVYVGPINVMEGATARWWNSTLVPWKPGDVIYGLYFRVEMTQPVGNRVKGPLVTVYPCLYEFQT